MGANRWIDRIGICMTAMAVLLALVLSRGTALGIQSAENDLSYENLLFDTEKIHFIDIKMDSWEEFLSSCEDEQYVPCSVVIDKKRMDYVGIRAKGNTSLMNVRMSNSQRYSLKLEFDHYQKGMTYYGLDKLCLNNLIQDNTYMKDYLTFQLMKGFQVKAPLCSYALVTVNDKPWGLFLAVECIEDSFLRRCYGSAGGMLYKPDSMGMGGGPGNGRNFNMEDTERRYGKDSGQDASPAVLPENGTPPNMGGNGAPPNMGGNGAPPNMGGNGAPPNMGGNGAPPNMGGNGTPPNMGGNGAPPNMDGNGAPPNMGGNGVPPNMNGNGAPPNMGGNGFPPPDMGGNGTLAPPDMGGNDVKLQYIDDDPDSYANIFSSAKTGITRADKTRLMHSLKNLSEKTNLEDVLFTDDIIRYFVVHNYTVNGDSYTGGMIHNYYLYEKDGKLAMLPWDYNLAFGGFQNRSASESVNDPVDTPLSVSGDGTRPMADWIFSGTYLNLYHQYFREFLDNEENGDIDAEKIIQKAYELINDYACMEKSDPTHFCSRTEYEKGVAALREFCRLRSQSIEGQLNGSIPSTDEDQMRQRDKLIDASSLDLSTMGSMGMPGGPPPA